MRAGSSRLVATDCGRPSYAERFAPRSSFGHPNQLRHSSATQIRKEFGLEHAQVVLGHAKADMTQRYADTDAEKARTVARKIG